MTTKKICIWSTSFQADTLAIAAAMDRDPDIDLLVVAKNADNYLREPIARALNLSCRILDRKHPETETAIWQFAPDILLVDNHVPDKVFAPKLVFFWHGLPLKSQPKRDMRTVHKHCRRLVGKITKPNPKFLAQCYGPVDYNHRVEYWKIAPENCRRWGMPYADLLRSPPYAKADLEEYYQLDLAGRKTILLSLTWNYGANGFGVVGDDDDVFPRILETAADYDANILFSLHDRHRYYPSLLERIHRYAARYPRSFIKHKDQQADNLADLVASDVMICNYSSFIVYHYVTGKPSIHILPVDPTSKKIDLPTISRKRPRLIRRRQDKDLWIYPFTDNGGLLAERTDQLIQQLRDSLENPGICRDNAARFLNERVDHINGDTCSGIISELKSW